MGVKRIRQTTHTAFIAPDSEWSRKRSMNTWNRIMIQMKKKKNTSIDQKTSVSVMSARIIGGPRLL